MKKPKTDYLEQSVIRAFSELGTERGQRSSAAVARSRMIDRAKNNVDRAETPSGTSKIPLWSGVNR